MKKLNKTLTRALVILLSLVLITSSVVSTTLAKYTVTKSAKITAKLQAFGLTVTLDPNDTLEDVAVASKTGNSISYTFTEVTLEPGDVTTYIDALTAKITGKASVSAQVTISVNIDCSDTQFTLNEADFPSDYTNRGKVYNPIQFYVNKASVNTADKFHDADDGKVLSEESEKAIANQIKTNFPNTITSGASSLETADTISDGQQYKVTGSIAKGATVSADKLGVGFAWVNASSADADILSTYISSPEQGSGRTAPTFTITYTISVTQTGN